MRTLQLTARRVTGMAQQLVLVAAPHGGQRRARANALVSLTPAGPEHLRADDAEDVSGVGLSAAVALSG